MNYHILKNIKKMNKSIFILGIIIICFCIQIKYVKAEENNKIKVGYPIVEGFTELNNGVYSGYAYEYLREIAKHTGWEYEFIEMDLKDLTYELREGNIDIAAGIPKDDVSAELYDFPEYNAGYTYTTLSILKDNESITHLNSNTLNGIKVGYFESDKVKSDNFIKFCKINSIKDIDLISYPNQTGEELSQALKAKEVDAIISGDLLINNDERVVLKFEATPYYFVTTKGNTKILSQLNKALYKIKYNDSPFNQNLYNKYFQFDNNYLSKLTENEEDYINNMTPLKALYIDNYAPLHYYDNVSKEPKGIFIDLMNLIR